MATIVVPLVVLAVGAFVVGFSGNPKLTTMGYIAFFVGLFWCVALAAGHALHF
jgi:hypothetical protein